MYVRVTPGQKGKYTEAAFIRIFTSSPSIYHENIKLSQEKGRRKDCKMERRKSKSERKKEKEREGMTDKQETTREGKIEGGGVRKREE